MIFRLPLLGCFIFTYTRIIIQLLIQLRILYSYVPMYICIRTYKYYYTVRLLKIKLTVKVTCSRLLNISSISPLGTAAKNQNMHPK